MGKRMTSDRMVRPHRSDVGLEKMRKQALLPSAGGAFQTGKASAKARSRDGPHVFKGQGLSDRNQSSRRCQGSFGVQTCRPFFRHEQHYRL